MNYLFVLAKNTFEKKISVRNRGGHAGMNSLLSRYGYYCRSSTCLRRHYAKVAQKSGVSVQWFPRNYFNIILSGSSSRKLAKTLEPTDSDRGHLEIAPKQSKKLPSFVREEAPHTTRVPAPLWNKPSRRPVERSGRWSSVSLREPEKTFGREKAEPDWIKPPSRRPVERPERRSSDSRREPERTFGREKADPDWIKPSRRPVERPERQTREPERTFGREKAYSDRIKPSRLPVERPERWSSNSRREPERTFGRGEADSLPVEGPERSSSNRRQESEKTFGGREAGNKVAESNDKRFNVAESYKHYLERQDSRRSGNCSVSCHRMQRFDSNDWQRSEIHPLTTSQTHQIITRPL